MVSSNSYQWASGDAYERCDGRWGRMVAGEFVQWLRMPEARAWVDVGCGTGELTRAILQHANPHSVTAVDLAEGFIEYARANTADERATFIVGDACAIPIADASTDCVIAGLVLNFVRSHVQMLREMHRILTFDGVAGLYVWDYSKDMQLLRAFWDAAIEIDTGARCRDEGHIFPICHPDRLRSALESAGLVDIDVRKIDVVTVFRDFEDYWTPFLSGHGGPAPAYAMSLSEKQRTALREKLRSRLLPEPDGSIRLIARAWGARAAKPSRLAQ